MSPDPLVSCVMPTRDRPAFVALAVECFLGQDHPARELVVVDDGERPVGDLLPDDPRIRYERLGGRAVLGAKRNVACGLARGELIAHWDDDDFSAPHRLSTQVAALRSKNVDVTGLDELLFFDPLAEKAWVYTYPERQSRPWVAGGTLCYRKRFWAAHPFPEIRVGEDSRFVWTHGARVAASRERGLYAATVHAGNTSVRHPRPPRWRAASRADVAEVMGAPAVEAYRAAAAAPAARAKAMPTPVRSVEPLPQSHVTVTIPYFRCRPYIRQCVTSVLGQTHRNLTAVVVNDGDPDAPWELLADIDDERLVCFDLPRNRGRYFADQVVLQGCEDRYLLVHDADDWSEPQRVSHLLRALRAEHATGAISTCKGPRVPDLTRLTRPPRARLEHLANLHGLFRTDALRAVGGFYAGFTVGYDTFLVNALVMTGRLAPVFEPLYTWRSRPDSLTQSPATGVRSQLRRATAVQLRELHRQAHATYGAYLDSRIEADELAATISRLGAARVTAAQRLELDGHAKRLAAVLAGDAPGRIRTAPRRAPPTRPRRAARAPHDVAALLEAAGPIEDPWSISKPLALELGARLEQRRPRRILELGSGLSTAVLAHYALRHKASVVTLEHDAEYAARTQRQLERLGVARGADVRVAALRPFACPDGRERPFYDTDPGTGFDFAFVDGPPSAHGRGGALFAIHDRLAGDWEVWLDDAAREHEQSCLALWERFLGLEPAVHSIDRKGLAVLTPRSAARAGEVPLDGLGVSILTGGRPDLLRRTLESITERAADALRAARVLILVNGRDPVAERYARSLPFVDAVRVTPRQLGIGPATSTVVAELAAMDGVELVLHLEDDWIARTVETGWLHRAAAVLRDDERVGQVRLRHRGDRVLQRHMVTGRPIEWETRDGFLRAPAAHFTFNPSLLRAREVRAIFPAADERAAQRRFLAAGFATAQLTPGVFRHLGDRRSIRASAMQRRR